MPMPATSLEAVATKVDEARLWRRHMEMAAIGAMAKGGVCREAFTAEDIRARILLAEWGAAIGLSLHMDDIGNMFLRRPGGDSTAPPVMTGSHLDTQPTGGKFDGAFGVLAALEAVQAIAEAGIQTRHPIEVANWTNEEGGRFVPGVMGSQVYRFPEQLPRMLAVKDAAGVSLAEGLAAARAALPKWQPRALKAPVSAFLEAHIEQGTVLEDAGKVIGIVSSIQGSRKFFVDVRGEDAHAGTTPRRRRKDALLAAVAMVGALERLLTDRDDVLRFTVGRFTTSPGAPSVIPGHVHFSIDFRHPDDALRQRLGDQVGPLCQALAGPCAVEVQEPQASETVPFQGVAVEAVRNAAKRLGLPAMELYSGAGHDARNLAYLCPTAMVFVPCEKGISHNEAENATAADLAAGARVIAQALVELANP